MAGLDGWDLYREIHKAMRYALFGVTTRAGATDPADAAAVQALVDEWRAVSFVLDGHHGHEDEHLDPLVRQHAAPLRDELEAGHARSDAAFAGIEAQVAAVSATSSADRPGLLLDLHLDLADATADYLGHLRFEEARVMPALNAAMGDDELEAVTNAIRGSVPPDDMCTFIRYMVPAMNLDERVDMLGGMYAGAPPEIFDMFRGAAEACLPADEFRALATRAGFA